MKTPTLTHFGKKWPTWACYLFAATMTAAAFYVRLLLGVAYGERPLLILFVFPIILSAYVGGVWPGLFATTLSAVLVDFFLLPPDGSFRVTHAHDLVQLLMLITNGVAISVLTEALHRHRSGMEKLSGDQADAIRKLKEEMAERKRAEAELTNKNQEMERFTYMVSHDLKSPLVTIKTFLGYLGQDIEKEGREKAIEDICHISGAADKMEHLLGELLEMSRIGRTGSTPKLMEYGRLVDEAVAAVSGQITQRGVEIRKKDDLIMLFGDRSSLEAVWQNLVENAVKYMGDQPAPVIELGVEGTGPETLFYVRDNGIGIDPGDLDRIFDFGVKLEKKSEGSGLGLTMTKKIVEMYGGTIRAESEGTGHGSCFRFTLPEAVRNAGEAT